MVERTRVGAGGTVVVGSNPAQSLDFFFFLSLTFENFFKFFGGLVAGARSAKFSVPVPGL